MDSIAQGVTTCCHSGDENPEVTRAREIGPLLEVWSGANLRTFAWRTWTDPYKVTVTEVLLQQTAAVKVAGFVGPFFERYPTWEVLEAATTADLEEVLRPLGLHRRRADVLHRLTVSMVHDPAADLANRPGIGQYISRAVAVSLTGSAEAMVDVNFVRILKRAFDGPWMSDYRYDARLQALASAVIRAASDARAVNWAVLDLAARTCRPTRPNCPACPIMEKCRTGLTAGGVP